MSTMPLELNTNSPDFKWGNMPPQDIPGQLTRSMLEMRKAKAYELKELPSLPLHVLSSKDANEVSLPSCPIVQHSIQLLMYIRQANSLISGHANKIADLSMPPPYQPKESAISHKYKSSTFNPRTGKASQVLFVAPELGKEFRHGMDDSILVPISQDTAAALLKESVQSVAAHTGYEEITTSCLNVLSGVTRNFMESFSKCMRDALDREAETGCPPFYDVLDETLNHSGTKNLKDLQMFWNSRIVQRHQNLEKEAMDLSREVRSLSYSVREVDSDQVTRSKFGKWTPVAGMRSGSDLGRRRDSGSINRSIKSEHHDYTYQDTPDIFTERKPAQENPFDFDDGMDSTFGMGELDNHHMSKRSRNVL